MLPEALSNVRFPVDHYVAESIGGPTEMWNLVLACWPCNQAKWQAPILQRDQETGQEVPTFNPRTQGPEWELHLRLYRPSGWIRGLTPVGRVTVRRLKMNGKKTREARKLWMQLGQL
ncbi:MAG: HNH endonuclease [Chloroflexi bacterium]|nr:HNH endonuclease [Chloroflexota bacterium]